MKIALKALDPGSKLHQVAKEADVFGSLKF
jgi:hypothetical protein